MSFPSLVWNLLLEKTSKLEWNRIVFMKILKPKNCFGTFFVQEFCTNPEFVDFEHKKIVGICSFS